MLSEGQTKSLFRPAGYFAFVGAVGLIIYSILVITVASPALFGSLEERLAYMTTNGGLIVSLYILFIVLALVEVSVVLGLVALTIRHNFRCAIFAGTFELLNISVRIVSYMVLISVLSGVVKGFVSADGFTFWDNFGYMIEGGGFFLQTVAWGLFGWSLRKKRGLERVAGFLMLLYAIATFSGGMLRIFGLVSIDFPDVLNALSIGLVGPTMGVLSIIIFIVLGIVFLRKVRQAAD